jgi:hypothetical protein
LTLHPRQFVKTRTSADESAVVGTLNLRLSGFSRQEIVTVDDVVRAVDLVPAFHLEGLREIVYLPEAAPGVSLLLSVYSPLVRTGIMVWRKRKSNQGVYGRNLSRYCCRQTASRSRLSEA